MDILQTTEELKQAKRVLNGGGKYLTVFGSARVKEGSELANMAYEVGKMFSDGGYNVLTGGGPGIMQATSHGAYDGKSDSIGLSISLPHEQKSNNYLDKEVIFEHFQTRKAMLMNGVDGFVMFPGGYGTIDELMEVLTLIQTGKIKKTPIYLIGSGFWHNQIEQFKVQLKHGFINEVDLDLFKVIDDTRILARDFGLELMGENESVLPDKFKAA